MKNHALLIAALLLIAPGCTTTLTRQKIDPGKHPGSAGFQYYLPKQRYTITATFRLESCPDVNGDKDAAKRQLSVRQTATVTETSEPDPSEFHSIPLSTMTSGWKTTTFTGSVFPNQTLRSVGITVDDRSGAIIKSALQVTTSAARVAIGSPAGARSVSLCHDHIYKALDTIDSGRVKLLDPSLDQKAREAIVSAMVSSKDQLEITAIYVFDPTRNSPSSTFILGKALSKWFANPSLLAIMSDKDKAAYDRTITTGYLAKADFVADETIINQNSGVIYREPLPAKILICAGICEDVDSVILANLQTQVAQMGRYVVIPLENGPFQKNNVTLTFLQNGLLESFTYGNESTLERIAGSAAEAAKVAEGYVATRQAKEEADATTATGAELKAIRDETDLLKARSDRIEQQRRLLELEGAP